MVSSLKYFAGLVLLVFVSCPSVHGKYSPPTNPGRQRGCCPSDTCHATNDPHMKTFDGRHYELQSGLNVPGEYVMYKHNYLPLQVNGYFYGSGSILNVCGVAVRSGASIFRYIFNNYYCASILSPGVVHTGPEIVGANNGYIIVENPSFGSYKITLPTGTTVNVNSNRITIYASLEDYNKVRGLCGTFTGQCEDDFLLRSGSYNPFWDAGCVPDDWTWDDFPEFSESWRVTLPSESLFHTTSPSPDFACDDHQTIFYCACHIRQGQPQRYDFLYSGSVEEAAHHQRICVDCEKDVTDELFTGRPSPMFVNLFSDLDISSSQSAQPHRGWANDQEEEEATGHCQQAILNDAGIKACGNFIDAEAIQAATEECITDIKWTGTTDFTAGKVARIRDQCIHNLERDPDQWDDGKNNATLELICTINCPNACSLNGNCESSKCICHKGFEGDDCSIKLPDPETTTQSTTTTTIKLETVKTTQQVTDRTTEFPPLETPPRHHDLQ